MASELVSIIMPIWNGEPWLEEAVASVLNQRYPHWELLLIENGSTDDSWTLIQRFSDPRIRVFQQTHSSVSAARNIGLEQATGSLICFLDCDDRLPETSLEVRVEHFKKHPEVGFVDGMVTVWNQDFTVQIDTFHPTFEGIPLNDLFTLSGKCFYGITWMIRSTVIGEHRFNSHMSHSEDLAFFAQLSLSNWRYTAVKSPVYAVRKRANSAMSDLDGLAAGYRLLYGHFESLRPEVNTWKSTFRKKVRRILFRSYMKKLQIRSALASWKRWS